MSYDVVVLVQPDEIDQIIDAFAEGSQPSEIAYTTGLAIEKVRQALEDPETIKRAMSHKAGKMALWAFGQGLDRLKEKIDRALQEASQDLLVETT